MNKKQLKQQQQLSKVEIQKPFIRTKIRPLMYTIRVSQLGLGTSLNVLAKRKNTHKNKMAGIKLTDTNKQSH